MRRYIPFRSFFSLSWVSIFDVQQQRTPNNPLNVPPNVDRIVTTAQAFAMLLAAAYQNGKSWLLFCLFGEHVFC